MNRRQPVVKRPTHKSPNNDNEHDHRNETPVDLLHIASKGEGAGFPRRLVVLWNPAKLRVHVASSKVAVRCVLSGHGLILALVAEVLDFVPCWLVHVILRSQW